MMLCNFSKTLAFYLSKIPYLFICGKYIVEAFYNVIMSKSCVSFQKFQWQVIKFYIYPFQKQFQK
jgi:hypothetical protein